MAAAGAPGIGGMVRQMAILPVLWGTKSIDFEDETNRFYLLCVFGVVMSSVFISIQMTTTAIKRKNDTGRVANPGTLQTLAEDQKAEDGSCSICAYDLAKIGEAKMQLFMSAAIGMFVHIQWGYTQPLIVMSVMQPLQAFDNKAIKVHLFGMSGPEFERPWASANAGNPLADWAERKKAEAEAESKKAIGKKKD